KSVVILRSEATKNLSDCSRFTNDIESRALAGLGPSRHVLGMIGQHDLRAGALNRRQTFQHDPLLFQPAVADCGFHHRILAAYVVRTNRDIEAVPNLAN